VCKVLLAIHYIRLNMCLSSTVNDIFNVEYWRGLEMWARVRSRSVNMALIDRSYTTY